MFTVIKWLLGLIVVIGLGYALWWSGWLKSPTPPPQAPTETATTTQATTTPQDPNGMSAANDSSDTALTQDTAALDKQLDGLTADTKSAVDSANDTPVVQSL